MQGLCTSVRQAQEKPRARRHLRSDKGAEMARIQRLRARLFFPVLPFPASPAPGTRRGSAPRPPERPAPSDGARVSLKRFQK